MDVFKLDDRVKVIGKNVKGVVSFIGKTHLSNGIMYGIALDKPKGRCSGEIGDVRYFICPKDHGVFVRACQLELDSGNSSEYSEDVSGDVMPRPAYPNYLKYSSKMKLKKSKYHQNSKEHLSKGKSSLKPEGRKPNLVDDNRCLANASPTKVNIDPGFKKKKRHMSRKREEKRASDDEKFRFLAEKINTQTQQLDCIRRHLKKLKTYFRWSRGFVLKETQMKNLLDTAIDSVIRNMVEIVGNSDIRTSHDHCKGDIGLEMENHLLLQCISDLEKKNETLVECMSKVRSFLLNSWRIHSRGKVKSNIHKKEISAKSGSSENKSKKCSPKKPETQSVTNSLSLNLQHSGDSFLKDGALGDRETETIKRYLESLALGSQDRNQEAKSPSGLHSKKEKRCNDNPEENSQQSSKVVCVKNYLEALNQDIKELNKELRGMHHDKCNDKNEERFNSRLNLLDENPKSPNSSCSLINDKAPKSPKDCLNSKLKTKRPKINLRSQPYVADKKLKWEQNASNENTDIREGEKDPTKELCDLISNIMTNITLDEQNEIPPEDSPKQKEQNRSATSVSASKCCSNPNSDKFEKVSSSSNKTKSEDHLKSMKLVRGGNSSRNKSQKKSVHSKQTTEARK